MSTNTNAAYYQNRCADLKIETASDSLAEIFEVQRALQTEYVEKRAIGKVTPATLGEIYDTIRDNKIALDDEFKELVDALPGVHDGGMSASKRSGLWKRWKSDNEAIRDLELSQLSTADRTELEFEYCDMFLFFINIGLALGIDGTRLGELYKAKTGENFSRIERGY